MMMHCLPLDMFIPCKFRLPVHGTIFFAPDLRDWCIESLGYVPDIHLGAELHPVHPPYPHLLFRQEHDMVLFRLYTAGLTFHLWPKRKGEWWVSYR